MLSNLGIYEFLKSATIGQVNITSGGAALPPVGTLGTVPLAPADYILSESFLRVNDIPGGKAYGISLSQIHRAELYDAGNGTILSIWIPG